MWSLGLCRNIPALSCVHPGLCRKMPAEPEPFVMLMHELTGWVFKPDFTRVRIFHSECQRELAVTSSETQYSRLPEEDSSEWILTLKIRFHKLTLTAKSLHLSGLRKSAKKAIVCLS